MKKEIIGICILIAVFVTFAAAFGYMDTVIDENIPTVVTPSKVTPLIEDNIVILETLRIPEFSVSIRVLHDNKRNVTCWKIGSSLSCIPDHLLEEKTERWEKR